MQGKIWGKKCCLTVWKLCCVSCNKPYIYTIHTYTIQFEWTGFISIDQCKTLNFHNCLMLSLPLNVVMAINWLKVVWVKFKESCHHAKFDIYHVYLASKKTAMLKFLPCQTADKPSSLTVTLITTQTHIFYHAIEKDYRSLVSWCFEPSQPQRITSGLKRIERYISKRLNFLRKKKKEPGGKLVIS